MKNTDRKWGESPCYVAVTVWKFWIIPTVLLVTPGELKRPKSRSPGQPEDTFPALVSHGLRALFLAGVFVTIGWALCHYGYLR